MSSFSQKFASITAEFPAERETLSRLASLVGTGQQREMTLDHLIQRLRPSSDYSLARILERLVAEGIIGRVFRVVSPADRLPIEDFPSFSRVPEVLFDWHNGTEISVRPRDVRVVYKLA